SEKTTSGCGFPGQRTSKKLIARVRPGVELVLAILVPSRELMTLDLPTFERPRNATSGTAGAGNWLGASADVMNRERTRTLQFPGSRKKLQVAERQSRPSGRLFSTSLSSMGWYRLRRCRMSAT